MGSGNYFVDAPFLAPPQGNVIKLSVGNAVPGVPQVHRTCTLYAVAAFGGRNAEDGVPYGCFS